MPTPRAKLPFDATLPKGEKCAPGPEFTGPEWLGAGQGPHVINQDGFLNSPSPSLIHLNHKAAENDYESESDIMGLDQQQQHRLHGNHMSFTSVVIRWAVSCGWDITLQLG